MNSNLKWLLLIPVLLVAIGLGILIPRLVTSGDDDGQSAATRNLTTRDTERVKEIQGLIAEYEALLETSPGDLDVTKALADNYYQLAGLQEKDGSINDSFGSYKHAVDGYRSAVAADPGNIAVRISLALSYYGLRMDKVALRELRSITTEDPAYLIELANAFIQMDQPVDGEQRLRAVNTDDPELLIELGLVYLEGLQRFEDAERQLSRAVELDPDNQRGWLSLGYVRFSANNVEAARAALERAVAIDPASPIAEEAESFLSELNQ